MLLAFSIDVPENQVGFSLGGCQNRVKTARMIRGCNLCFGVCGHPLLS